MPIEALATRRKSSSYLACARSRTGHDRARAKYDLPRRLTFGGIQSVLLDDGDAAIDSNTVGPAIQSPALAQTNALFGGSGGEGITERSPSLYSRLASP